MQPSYRSQSQTGKSKRSTCHPWWFGEHTEEWRCHPLARHLGSCPGCCTWDCRNLRTIPELGRLARQIRSQSLGCRSEWGWLPRPPATKALHKKKCNISQPPKPLKHLGPIAYASSCDGQFTCWHVHCMKPGLKALHGSQFPASNENETVFLFLPQLTPRPAANGTFPRPMICIQLWYSKWFPKPNAYHMNHMCFPCKSNCVRRNAFSKTASTHAHLYAGLRHHSFHKSLVGGIVGAKTNSHDLLARSSTWHQHQVKLRSHSLTERNEHPHKGKIYPHCHIAPWKWLFFT